MPPFELRFNGVFLFDAANHHQEALELGIIAIALPEIDKLADNLKISNLVMS